MKTLPATVRKQSTMADLRAEIARFEATYPGTNSTNFSELFHDADGNIPDDRLAEYFRVSQMYAFAAQ